MNAEMPRERFPGSVRASTTAIPPTDALVMKALLPFRTHSPSRHSARVRRAAASEPEPGSVSPQAPSTSPEARRGRYRRFCASEPNAATSLEHSELCAHIVMPTEGAPQKSSSEIYPSEQ